TVQDQLAIGNAILTTEDEEQALDRADPSRRNNAGHAVDAALILAGIGQDT
ncbi:MAG TPA: 6,7-dimethyl-8-ribityllumazine synthase, partial [Alphaproteobacteria bacterium]|nr:6,7-dimethyl-8-ribityllumazine synthase [Alphaproteobacteria bacterium]